ncbi:MAG: mannose-phosphate guanylyltransferase / phosphomannomutase [Acidobacteriota bacterium]|nr:mannose-phosphate guanylyltransferase / phosphomannomutase [Acidobacteriota bacterium]
MTIETNNISTNAGNIKLTVLAAGLGKRMEPLTAHHLPKPMFPIGGSVPMVEMWVRRAIKSGITDISMNLCVLGDTIKNYFKYGDGAKFGANISFIEEECPSGTLGGVCKQALGNKVKQVQENEPLPLVEEFKGTTIIAPSGDIVTNFSAELLDQMYDIHTKKGAAFTMVLTPVPWEKRGEFGTVELKAPESLHGLVSQSGQIVEFREKDPNSPTNLNNASIYMIEMDFLKTLDRLRTPAETGLAQPFYDFGKHVFPAMLGKLAYTKLPKDFLLWGLRYDGLWHDVGRKRDYLDVNRTFLDGGLQMEIPYEKRPWGYLGTNVNMDFSKVTINPPVVIGSDCIIEPGAVLGPYAVIGDGWTIERKAIVINSVLWKPYSYFTDDETEIPVNERKTIVASRVREGVTIDGCIIVGGTIETDLHEKTVDVLRDGQINILSIDYVPKAERA